MTVCVINGTTANNISAFDRGLAYGDGVFTTAKIISGEIDMLEQHLARLRHSCQVLFIDGVDYNALSQQLSSLVCTHNTGVLKVIITAGQGGRGYSRVGIDKPNIIISINPFPAHYNHWQQEGICLGDSKLKIGLNPLLAGIKHLNRLEQVLLRRELDQYSQFDDLVVYDLNDKVVETTSSNLFWLKEGQWFTPKIKEAGVNGLKRKAILSKHTDIIEIDSTKDTLAAADALFICNSIMGIVPIKQYNDRTLSITPVVKFSQRFMDDKE